MSKQKVVIITGILGGIGTAMSKLFQENNWKVIGIDRYKQKQEKKDIYKYYKIDLSKEGNIEKVVYDINKDGHCIDALINNAAIQICKPLLKTTIQDLNKVYAVNVFAPFLLSKYLYPLLAKSKGSIVNICSVHAVATSKNISAYASSKGALTALTRSMALEFADDGIRVNAILPGAIETPMLRMGLSRENGMPIEEKFLRLSKRHALGRIGSPSEIAEVAYFFSNNNSSFVTGQTLIVDGGGLSRLSTE